VWLATPEEVLSLLQDIGYPHAVFDNAPLDVWLPMMILSENLLERKALSECQRRLNQLFFASERTASRSPIARCLSLAKNKRLATRGPWLKMKSKLEDPGSKESVLLNPRFSNSISPSSDPWPPPRFIG